MSSYITSSVEPAGTTNAVKMSNSTFARKLSLPTDWNVIRIGMRMFIPATTGISGLPRFAVGLCSGTDNQIGDASATHFAGVITNQASWNYVGQYNHFAQIATYPCVKYGTTLNTGSTALTSDSRINVVPTKQCIWAVEITKGNPNYTFKLYCPNTSYDGSAYISPTEFAIAMNAGAGGMAAPAHAYSSAQTLPVSEATYGTFDGVNVWWNRTDNNVVISDLALVRLS